MILEKNSMRRMVIVLSCLSQVGCASLFTEPPVSEPHAVLTVRNMSTQYTSNLRVHHQNAEACSDLAVVNTGQGKTIDRNEVPPVSEFTFRISASRPFGVYLSTQRPKDANTFYGCGSVGIFQPAAGAKYVAEFSYQPPRCQLKIEELVGDRKVAFPVQYRRQMPTSIAQPTPWCSD
jgi:hypothetical protein